MSTGAKTGEGHIPALDGWRGLAILAVLIGHFFDTKTINLGLFGVELFFVLSGRLMADILFVKKFDLGQFFYRRASRILPALIVFVIIVWIAVRLSGTPLQMSPLWMLASVTFTLNYAMIYHAPTVWFDHIWSLCVEEHSYMLLGLIALVFGRGKWALGVVWALAILAMLNGVIQTTFLNVAYAQAYWRSDVHLASIFISGAIFMTVRRWKDHAALRAIATPLFLLCVALGLLAFHQATPLQLIYTGGTTCLAIAVALVDVVAKPVQQALSFAPLRQLGLWSYSVYLWQQPFYKIWMLQTGIPTLLLLGAAIACGVISYYVIEKPARLKINAAWGRWSKRRPKPATAETGG